MARRDVLSMAVDERRWFLQQIVRVESQIRGDH